MVFIVLIPSIIHSPMYRCINFLLNICHHCCIFIDRKSKTVSYKFCLTGIYCDSVSPCCASLSVSLSSSLFSLTQPAVFCLQCAREILSLDCSLSSSLTTSKRSIHQGALITSSLTHFLALSLPLSLWHVTNVLSDRITLAHISTTTAAHLLAAATCKQLWPTTPGALTNTGTTTTTIPKWLHNSVDHPMSAVRTCVCVCEREEKHE